MVAAGEFEQRPYERLLPPIGFWVDESGAWRFKLVESADGFLVSVQGSPEDDDLESREFSVSELQAQAELRPKRIGRDTRGNRMGFLPVSRREFFRALGFELESSGARSILLDEIDDGLLLTYSYLDATQGYLWRKRMLLIDRVNAREILDAAAERGKSKRGGILGFLRSS